MELWLLLGILSYLSFAISTTIDKDMMNRQYGALRTNTIKMFLDGVILLAIGFLFFELKFTFNVLLGALLLGGTYALAGVLYFKSLKLKDVATIAPFMISSIILFVFLGSVFLLNETVNALNYAGVFLIVGGIYLILSEKSFSIPRPDKGLILAVFMVILVVFGSLLTKILLFNAEPITLGVLMYFSSALFLLAYNIIFRKASLKTPGYFKQGFKRIFAASFFGALATALLFLALSIEDASKVYPLGGIQSVFIFAIAVLFLKEKFYGHKLLGILIVFAGVFLVGI
ncbi:MAG: DMT family transporter [Candidatus Aenigmarchaeota archaeon]|nr:DMT family transporter [Candidatus Aenigmarchaeota archaeon]